MTKYQFQADFSRRDSRYAVKFQSPAAPASPARCARATRAHGAATDSAQYARARARHTRPRSRLQWAVARRAVRRRAALRRPRRRPLPRLSAWRCRRLASEHWTMAGTEPPREQKQKQTQRARLAPATRERATDRWAPRARSTAPSCWSTCSGVTARKENVYDAAGAADSGRAAGRVDLKQT
jgi:hypothetical protein